MKKMRVAILLFYILGSASFLIGSLLALAEELKVR
jgi:hypothetical protein